MTTIAEENIIKKRLLIEGDSGNEDKLINKLTKSFIKWASCVQSEGAEADETCDALFEQMQISLSHAEFGLLRNHLIYDMNQMEQNNYKVLYETINNDIDKAEKKIVEKKVELQEARKIRKNRQEYDLLARRIQEYPDRLQMQETIRNLEERMKNIKKTDAEYDKKIELRHKQFSVVLQSVSSLKSLIESDINPSDLINTDRRKDDVILGDNSNNNNNNNDEDMEDEGTNLSTRGERREKHYSTNEVEMDEA